MFWFRFSCTKMHDLELCSRKDSGMLNTKSNKWGVKWVFRQMHHSTCMFIRKDHVLVLVFYPGRLAEVTCAAASHRCCHVLSDFSHTQSTSTLSSTCRLWGGGEGWRIVWRLFVIDLIMENSPWHCSQRMQGLWHLHEKYSCCAGFCHKMPVDKAQPWQAAKRERWGREGHGVSI